MLGCAAAASTLALVLAGCSLEGVDTGSEASADELSTVEGEISFATLELSSNPDLAKYPMCTEAVMDYAVVGMCKLNPSGDVCEPGLAPRFEANVQRCRELAARK